MQHSLHFIDIRSNGCVTMGGHLAGGSREGRPRPSSCQYSAKPPSYLINSNILWLRLFWGFLSVVPQIDLYIIEDNISKIIDIWLKGAVSLKIVCLYILHAVKVLRAGRFMNLSSLSTLSLGDKTEEI